MLAETIFMLFKTKEKTTLRWEDVLQALKQSNVCGNFVEDKDYHQRLVKLAKVCPDWINLITVVKTTLIKQLRKGVQVYDIKEQIRNYFNANPQ
jgi:hypothetical protein